MDVTILFKACVKTVRTTNKILDGKVTKTNILKTTPRDVNLAPAKDIVRQITKLGEFLVENRAAYLNMLNYLSTNKTMSEVDREEIDRTAQKTIQTCSSLIGDYKKHLSSQKVSKQKEEHYRNIQESLEHYLKAVSKIYSESKAIRVKRFIDTHRLSKLETTHSESKCDTILTEKPDPELVKKEKIPFPATVAENIDNQLSAEEMQLFEMENEQLFNELNALSDEVKQIESKVVHISELQEMFTEKVLQQEKDIDRIANTVSVSTDNMRDANEQIRQAIQRNAGLRVWILFFLLIMSFSLLFLDWYND